MTCHRHRQRRACPRDPKQSFGVQLGALVLVLVANACSGGSPSAPSRPSLTGTWNGTVTILDVSGGECMASGFQPLIGVVSPLFSISISQTGSEVSAPIPTLFGADLCPYSGTVNGDSFSLAASNCRQFSGLSCGDGRFRDVASLSATFTGRFNDKSVSATAVETWSVSIPGTHDVVGILKLTSSWNLVR